MYNVPPCPHRSDATVSPGCGPVIRLRWAALLAELGMYRQTDIAVFVVIIHPLCSVLPELSARKVAVLTWYLIHIVSTSFVCCSWRCLSLRMRLTSREHLEPFSGSFCLHWYSMCSDLQLLVGRRLIEHGPDFGFTVQRRTMLITTKVRVPPKQVDWVRHYMCTGWAKENGATDLWS